MSFSQGSDETLIATIHAAPKALVFLSVPWSCPERIARQRFVNAASRLSELSLGVECFLIDEEAETCQRWLSSLNLPQLGGCPLGAGSLLWLEEGRIVSLEISGQQTTAEMIVKRCHSLWVSNL